MSGFKERYRDNANFRLFIQILVIFVLSRIFLGLMVPVYNGIMGTNRSFSFLMNEWDAKKYVYIIDHGYTFPLDTDPQANWAFFPLYSLVCMALKFVTFGVVDTYWIGMIVSNLCIFTGAFYAVKIVRMLGLAQGVSVAGTVDAVAEKPGNRASQMFYDEGLLVAVFMLAGPYSFYCSSVYTEAMFIMFIVLFFYCAMKKKFMLAGIMAALASGTRIVGCTLVFALLVEMYLDYVQRETQDYPATQAAHTEKLESESMGTAGKVLTWKHIGGFVKYLLLTPQRIVALFLCPLGTFLYMCFLRFFCGDAWAFKSVQIAWREDIFFPIVGVMWKACTGQIEPRYTYMGWICVAVFAVYGYMLYRKFYSMAIFGIIALLIPLTSHVMSTCRFIIGTFVVFVGLYDMLKRSKKQVRWLVLAAMAVWEIILVFMWYNSDCWLL